MSAIDTTTFLSHLCGGKCKTITWNPEKQFLSHLCGGKSSMLQFAFFTSFLSHLCGGKYFL
ncbi:hypothetical protein [uncultured Gammaproteobacteria bacterium]|nr:hypothetical protein [uncultured Gammaproteobacteria bacterium]CAC9570292.1 hypothetical protein [uncultured Gammaproteobacteria bacterium]CAC9585819.1 hypothetical protein [uncultured Gammaproteobacteria bacterium]